MTFLIFERDRLGSHPRHPNAIEIDGASGKYQIAPHAPPYA